MKFSVSDKPKKDTFIAIFQLLKGCTNAIKLIFNEDHIYIQGMDKSHVCLFDIKIVASWFASYDLEGEDKKELCIDMNSFSTILSVNQDSNTMIIHHESDDDTLCIDFLNEKNVKGEFNRHFHMPLVDLEMDLLHIPDVEYDAEFTVNSKKICEIISQLTLFGDTMEIKCTEETIDLISSGVLGKMLVNIPIDDLAEYGINEGETVELAYSISYIHKMCATTKLSSDVSFSISASYPMRIKYDLGNESYVTFYLAPKI